MIRVERADDFLRGVKGEEPEILSAGYAEVDESWHGEVSASAFSRLYVVSEGSFTVTGYSGSKITVMAAPGAYLIPSGYSCSFRAEGRMVHAFFHLRLPSLDGMDMLRVISEPLGMPISSIYSKEICGSMLTESVTERLLLRGEMCRILAGLLRFSGKEIAPTRYSPAVRAAIAYINSRTSVAIRISGVAEAAHTAESTIRARFRRELGESIGDYVTGVVMQDAERRLVTTDMPIGEIAECVGFTDQLYFSRRFKEYFGSSPREYRRMACSMGQRDEKSDD